MGALFAPTKSARISIRLFVEAVLVETTLGLAETDADRTGPTATGIPFDPLA